MMRKNNKVKLGQGEIFGIALLFVIVIIGIIVYSQFTSINERKNDNLQQEGQYKILAEGTLNSLLKMSTGCFVERHRDSLKDVINYCLENDNYYADYDPTIQCNNEIKYACAYVLETLETSLFYMFNNTESDKGLGNIPFELHMDLPSNKNTYLSNKTFTNFNHFMYHNVVINESNIDKIGYKRAPSGLIAWSTSDRGITFELYLYYK